jgi:hypothetical protein
MIMDGRSRSRALVVQQRPERAADFDEVVLCL